MYTLNRKNVGKYTMPKHSMYVLSELHNWVIRSEVDV